MGWGRVCGLKACMWVEGVGLYVGRVPVGGL